MKFVIIGAGPAGVRAAETLRENDAEADITLVGGEPGEPYARMAIPYILTGAIDDAGARQRRSLHHLQALGIRYLHGRARAVQAGPAGIREHIQGIKLGLGPVRLVRGAKRFVVQPIGLPLGFNLGKRISSHSRLESDVPPARSIPETQTPAGSSESRLPPPRAPCRSVPWSGYPLWHNV